MSASDAASKPECPACVEENGGWTCYHGEGCIIEEAFGPTDSQKRREAESAASEPNFAAMTRAQLWQFALAALVELRQRQLKDDDYDDVSEVGP